MTKNEVKKSRKIKKLEVLINRTPETLPEREKMINALGRELAGYEGELTLEYYLKFVKQKEFIILHNIRLEDANGFFQMDALLLTKCFILILDSKNWAGVLTYDPDFRQIIQTNKGIKNVFSDPILQVDLQLKRLKEWMKKNKLPPIPVKSNVVFTNRNVILEMTRSNYEVSDRMLKAPEVLSKIELYEKTYHIEMYSNKEVSKLSKLLIKHDKQEDPDYLEKFNISKSDIIKGVQCKQCSKFAMKRYNGKWICRYCGYKSVDAHLAAIQDYSLLYGREITNRQLREFLLLPSRSIAQKILFSMNLLRTGTKQRSIYHLPKKIE